MGTQADAMTIAYRIVEDDPQSAEANALLRLHLDDMHRFFPPETMHVKPMELLLGGSVAFWTAWDGPRLAAIGALRDLGDHHGEVTAMRAHPDYRNRGAGKAILLHLLAEAYRRGFRRLSLETGRADPFLPARRLYERHGFSQSPPFAGYPEDEGRLFMTRSLSPSTRLRQAVPADAPALARLGADAFTATFGQMYAPADLQAFLAAAHSPETVQAEIADPDRICQLAEVDGMLGGYCKLVLRPGWPEHARRRSAMELKQLYTAPGMTRLGIGAALMDWALATARARGGDEMQLSVWSGNVDAQRFYTRYGFTRVADITFAVGSQIDEEFLFSALL